MFFFLTWYVKRTPYVVLILMYSRSSGFSVLFPIPSGFICTVGIPSLSFPPSHSLTLLTFPSSPLLTLQSSHFLHNHISLLYLFLFKNKII